jgi:hypothetical protein
MNDFMSVYLENERPILYPGRVQRYCLLERRPGAAREGKGATANGEAVCRIADRLRGCLAKRGELLIPWGVLTSYSQKGK